MWLCAVLATVCVVSLPLLAIYGSPQQLIVFALCAISFSLNAWTLRILSR